MHSTPENIPTDLRPGPRPENAPRVVIAAGGTGGHVYPAIAIADALKKREPEIEVLFIGTKDHMEWRVVPKAGYNIKSIWISGFHRRLTLKNLMFPFKLATSLVQSYRLLGSFQPDLVVCCGGYVAGPVGWTAARRGIPLVLQEQNSYPGVTNRLLGRDADKIFAAFEDARTYFPEGKTEVTGNPTRSSLQKADREAACRSFEFDPHRKTLLVLGGSGGARSINEAMASRVEQLHDELGLQIIWQCGRNYFDKYRGEVKNANLPNLRLLAFLDNMDEAYAVADLVVSRAGALSCSELALTGTPSILVPSPHVAGDHQTQNARSMSVGGAAALVPDSDLADQLVDTVAELIEDEQRLQSMREAARRLAKPKAADDIAEQLMAMIAPGEH